MIWKSKMARRLVRTFITLVALPLICTVLILGRVGREQIVWTARTMEQINQKTVQEAGKTFQQSEHHAVHTFGTQTQIVSIDAINSMSGKMAHEQDTSLTETSRDLSALTHDSFNAAMRQSLATNRNALDRVRDNVTGLYARSAEEGRKKASGNIEKAMLALDDTLMQERASRLALIVNEHISDATNYLMLIAQMPSMSEGEVAGQKACLDSMLRRFPQFLRLTVLDKTGRETAMSASDHVVTAADLGSHPDADYFKKAIQDKTYLAVRDAHTDGKTPVLRLAVPIELYRGKAVGVLEAHISLEELWDTLRNTRVGHDGFAYIIDEKGRPVFPSRKTTESLLTCSVALTPINSTTETLPWKVVVAIPHAEMMQPIWALNQDIATSAKSAQEAMRQKIHLATEDASRLLQKDALSVRDRTIQRIQTHTGEVFNGLKDKAQQQTQDEVTAMQRALQNEQKAMQEVSDKQMEQAADAASKQLAMRISPLTTDALHRADSRLSIVAVIILVISCAIGCFFALLMASRIVRPVAHLAQVTHAVAEGELDKRVDEKAPDEIGDLAKAFNTMAASLQKSRSELNEAEGQLVQSAKLASLGTLSAGVAHELNQPVAIIRGLAQQLQGEEGLSSEVREDLVLIEGQTTRMTKIIKHLRTFCRMGGAEATEVDVNEVARNCFILIGAQLQSHNVSVEFELCEQAPPVVADANELEQVFLNLITNARDAMEGHEGACITLRSWVAAERFAIQFRDNGPGIPEEIASRIFDPFFTTKEPGKGTGLGLSISHSIIKKHHGEITLTCDRGAVFTITLPLAEGAFGEKPLAA